MKRVWRSWAVAVCVVFAPVSNSRAESALDLIEQCAPRVDAGTMSAIVRTESSGHMFVLSDDGPRGLPWSKRKHLIRSIYPGTREEAASIARRLISDGHLVGIGLTQVSSQHLPRLGISIEQLLDPCTNVSTGAGILHSLFVQAKGTGNYRNEDEALGAAVSAYNTGNFRDGFLNGYVRKVLANMRAGVPQLFAKASATRTAKRVGQARLATLPAASGGRAVSPQESSLDVIFE
ncbi:lytic transglycosylase domain-containing protein [Agrobacterium tumefaciens]|uniref:lytic transglycosylase domain-containing protein n=1 Tax=Agrobacterium tumefaciens TaxID=358 RepID=UPI001573BC80|nr:lytic transglycosylase domain-containing protein [Agrobacterium tumefaciens]NTB05904.1 lytic transglycosylase domain-containing protein [Agrobacterium tumefaciens]